MDITKERLTGLNVPWEKDGQFSPSRSASGVPSDIWEQHPLPWEPHDRGNEHVDFYDAHGKFIVHVYFWDGEDRDAWSRLEERVRKDFMREANEGE